MSSELDKPSRSASRLRLKMPKEKSEDDDDEKPIETKELTSPNKEDSLADFKSPKLNTKVYQNDSIKIIKDTSVKKIKKATKKPGKSKISGDSRKIGKLSGNEQSIESLFFRAQSEKSNFICPLCLKAFNDSNNQSIHTKNCAAKNNVSTRKLLAAVELQEKQKEERRAIGLPAGPISTIPKKRSNPTKRLPENDADIELALALSLSLREVEKMEEFEEAVAVAAGSNEKILEMSSSQRKSTLQSFGFSSNKPVGEAININSHKKKRRKLLGPTVLQSRTQETRERILTERISEILVGSQSITQQNSQEKRNLIGKNRKFGGVENKELNKWYKKSGNLWSRSQGNCGDDDYYVGELSKFIIREFDGNKGDEDDGNEEDIVEIKEEMEEIKMKQVGKKGEMKEVEKEEKIKKIEKQEKMKEIEMKEKIEKIEKQEKIKEDDEEMKNIENNAFVIQETTKTSDKSEEPKKIINFENSLKISWSRMIDNSHLSDLRIFVKNDSFIHAHNLVIWTRCGALTDDYKISNHQNVEDHKFQMIKYEVHWPHIDRNAAMIFLNYVYCSEVSADLLKDRKIRHQVRSLAEKYEMIDLFEYLKDSDDKSINEEIENYEKISGSRDFERKIDKSLNDELENDEKNYDNHLKEEEINNRSSNYSPDLFDDSEKFESLKETSIVSLSSENDEEKEIEPSIVSKKKEIDVCDVDEENLDDDDLDAEKSASNTPKIAETVAKKAKSNLSIFIDKVNRQQARGMLDSDTDGDTPLKNCEIYRKNPFKIRGNADDSLYSWKRNEIDKIDKIGVSSDRQDVKKTPLTVLEEEIRARALKNQFSGVNDDSLTVNSQESANSLEESMYTKYVKKKKKEENSINEYRDALKCLDDSEDDRLNRSIDPGSMILSSTRNNFNEKCEENTDLFDSDFEISDSLGVSGEKRRNKDDNTVGKDPDLDPDASSTPKSDDEGMQKNLGNFTQSKSKSQREKMDFREFSDSDDDFDVNICIYDQDAGQDDDCDDNHRSDDEMQENSRNFTQLQSKSKSKRGKVDSGGFLDSDSDFEISDPCEVPEEDKPNENVDDDDDCHVNHHNNDEIQEIQENFENFTQSKSKRGKQVFAKFDDSDFEMSDPCEEIPEEDKNNEPNKNDDHYDDFDPNHHNHNHNDNESQENMLNFTQSKSERVIILSSSEDEHCISSSAVRKRPHEDNLSSWEIPEEEISQCRSRSTSFTQKSASPRVQERENSQINEKIDEISNNFINKNSNKNENIKKADSPLKKSQKKNSANLKNPLKRRRVSSSFQISYNVTPPRDYDRMESPDLNEEMNKYGLKPQKRHRAVQLLQHIYNELHPSVPADMEVFKGLSFADSENEEPPCKKKITSPEILEKSISDEDFDEEIKTQVNEDVNCNSQSSLEDIKEAFNKLLTSNKQIFNKILTYEPLPLELLYENLINQGFKGKINEVISFLDDQCITFQVQENNKNRTKKKKKEKPLKNQDL